MQQCHPRGKDVPVASPSVPDPGLRRRAASRSTIVMITPDAPVCPASGDEAAAVRRAGLPAARHGTQELQDEHLAVLPGIQRLNSTLVMEDVVLDRPLPV